VAAWRKIRKEKQDNDPEYVYMEHVNDRENEDKGAF
jgi:hypothetical protein